MVIRFNADEVFEVAICTEQNGAAFYRKAAVLNAGKEDVEFLEKLAVMEDGHERIFDKMRKNLSEREKEPTVFDPLDEAGLYLSAMADTHGGEGSPAVADTLTGRESMAQILETAIELEKKSILLYVGLRDLVPENLGKSQIDTIINEEKSHVVVLQRKLNRVQGNA